MLFTPPQASTFPPTQAATNPRLKRGFELCENVASQCDRNNISTSAREGLQLGPLRTFHLDCTPPRRTEGPDRQQVAQDVYPSEPTSSTL